MDVVINKQKAITFFLIAFITFVWWFSHASALSIVVNSPNGGESWLQGTTHAIDFNVLAAGTQTDFNTSVLAQLYYSTIAGARTNLITSKTPLFETINPDSNSQGWIYNASGQNDTTITHYVTDSFVDGQGAWNIGMKAGGLYYSEWKKNILDTNFFDINKNGGKISIWVKTTALYDLQTIFLYLNTNTGSVWDSTCGNWPTNLIQPDTNNVWKKITKDLNKAGCASGNSNFDINKITNITITLQTDSPVAKDFNFGIDGIRIFDNKNCSGSPNFDGNQEANTNCTYNWTLPASGDLNNLYVDVNVSNGTTTSQDSSDSAFNFQGFQTKIYNEKTGTITQPDTYTIDGNSWLTYCTNGTCTIPFGANITTGYHVIAITKTSYQNRDFNINIDMSLNSTVNAAIIPDTNSDSYNFKFYLTDKTTLATAKIVRVIDLNHGYYAGQATTNSIGETTFALDINAEKYGFKIYNAIGTEYADYNYVTLTVKIPLDEKAPSTTITPFQIKVIGAGGYDLNAQNADKNITLYSNVKNPYTITIQDNNTLYYPRDYIGDYRGDTNTATLQPYLAKITELSALVFITKDKALNTVSNVKIVLSRMINGAKTAMASGYTDIVGSLPLYVEYGQTYSLDVYYPTDTLITELSTDNFKPTYNPTYLYISTGSIPPPIDLSNTTVKFIPAISFIYSGLGDLNQQISSDINFSRIRIYVDQNCNGDYNVFYDQNFIGYSNLNNDINLFIITTNVDYNYFFPFTVHIELWETTTKKLFEYHQAYKTGAYAGNLNFMQKLKDIRTDFGCKTTGICFGTSLLSLILTLLLTGTIGFGVAHLNAPGLAVIGIIILGFFSLVAWFDILLLMPIAILGLLIVRGDW